MRKAVAYTCTFKLYNITCFINEITLEQQSALQYKQLGLFIPLFVLLHMLEFLCCRHVDPMRAQAALDDLQDLVHHDQGVFVPMELRDISWEIRSM